MSTNNTQSVRKIIAEIKIAKGFHEDKELAEWIGVSKNVLSAWKTRDKIADYSVFVARGISEDWLRTGAGSIFTAGDTPITGTSHEVLRLSEHSVGRVGNDPDPIRAAINRELDRMTRKQLAEALSYLVSKNEEALNKED